MNLKDHIRSIKDYPKKGILFRDITTLIKNAEAFEETVNQIVERSKNYKFDKIAAVESGLNTINTLKPNFSWACSEINEIKNKYDLQKYILLFPFCSPHLSVKKWPYYDELIKLIKDKFGSEYKVVTAPGPNEIDDARKFDAISVLDGDKALNLSQLTSLIKESSFIVANDTGPAHIAAHVAAKGLTLFGKHTTAHKVSIERENFKAIQVTDLNNLSASRVFERLLNLL